jgi:hypothetical protein
MEVRINTAQTTRLRPASGPSTGWQWLKTKLPGWCEAVRFNLASHSLFHRMAGCLPRVTEPHVVHLRGNEVIRLTKVSGFNHVEVQGGAIWLTGTPADGDMLLRTGERFHLTHDWPFVLQAMPEAQIILRT